MIAFKLPKVLTLGCCIAVNLVLLSAQGASQTTSPPVIYQNQNDPCSSSESRSSLAEDKCLKFTEANEKAKCKNEYLSKMADKCEKKIMGDQSELQDCNKAYEKFTENDGKLAAACGAAGIDGDCFAHVDKCLKCQGTESTDPVCASLDTEEIDSTDPDKKPASISDFMGMGQGSSASTGKYTPDPKKAALRYKNCPAMAGVDLKEWMEKVKDAQREVTDSKKEVVDLTEKNSEIEAQLRDTKLEKDKAMTETVDAAEDVKQKMNDQMRDEKNEARKTISQLLEQSSAIENQIIAAEKSYDDAYSSYLNALAALDQQCHAAALQKLAALQTAMQAKIDKSTYSTGSFNSLLNEVGVSSRKKSQSMVNRDFQRCKADPAYTSTAQAAKRSLDSTRTAASNAIKALRDKKDQISSTIKDANERELPEALKGVVENANRDLAKLQNKLKQLALEKQAAIEDANKKTILNNQRIALANQKAAVAEQVLQQTQAYLNQKMVASGEVETDGTKISEAMSALTLVRSSAETVVASCGCNSDSEGAQNTSYCKSACTVLVKSHEEWEPTTSISDSMLTEECSSYSSAKKSSGGATAATPQNSPVQTSPAAPATSQGRERQSTTTPPTTPIKPPPARATAPAAR
ncbi:MAG: hypothetical protein IPL83_16640 [Bdellovibrionales bacterium]|nr:hypothetical protein [Bdellovibrionales bacterium]